MTSLTAHIHSGTRRFWHQRLTAAANIILVTFLVLSLAAYGPADYETVVLYLTRPWVAILLALFVLSAGVHFRIGLTEIIEDYVHAPAARATALALATTLAVIFAAVSLFALAKLNFGF